MKSPILSQNEIMNSQEPMMSSLSPLPAESKQFKSMTRSRSNSSMVSRISGTNRKREDKVLRNKFIQVTDQRDEYQLQNQSLQKKVEEYEELNNKTVNSNLLRKCTSDEARIQDLTEQLNREKAKKQKRFEQIIANRLATDWKQKQLDDAKNTIVSTSRQFNIYHYIALIK